MPDAPIINLELAGLNILLAEDFQDNRLLVTRYLKLAGATVLAVENGKDAMDQAMNGEFDVILMDLQMPVMDGYEAVTKLRSAGYTKPIIALTAHAMKEEKKRCLELGFNNHLTKPINRMQLISDIRDVSRH